MSTGLQIFLTALFKPFVLLVILCAVAVPRVLIQRKMRDGKLKRFLLRRI